MIDYKTICWLQDRVLGAELLQQAELQELIDENLTLRQQVSKHHSSQSSCCHVTCWPVQTAAACATLL